MTLNNYFTQTFTIKRPSPSTFVDGVFQQPSYSDISFIGSVQPTLNEDETLSLPAGQRQRGAIKIYSDLELRAGNDRTNVKADKIEFHGFEYEVFIVDNYTNYSGLPHYKSIALKLERDR